MLSWQSFVPAAACEGRGGAATPCSGPACCMHCQPSLTPLPTRCATLDLPAQARKYVPESLKLVSMFGCALLPGRMLPVALQPAQLFSPPKPCLCFNWDGEAHLQVHVGRFFPLAVHGQPCRAVR